MRSSDNVYLSNLDHLRAFAAFLVFTWHFTHHNIGCDGLCYGTVYNTITYPFFSLLEQGHTGVAFFLCISGYIFTRLTDGQSMHVLKFWGNRLLRLFPLILFWGFWDALNIFRSNDNHFHWHDMRKYVHAFFHPGGSWTIYLELRYYALFPLLQIAARKWRPLTLIGIALIATFLYRFHLWHAHGTVEFVAYSKLPGRADQFLAGSAAFYIEQWILRTYPDAKRILSWAGLAGFAGLLAFYTFFSPAGGYYDYSGYPSTSPLWIVMPLLEGIFYSSIIIAYLQLRISKRADKMLSAIGRWSYSIYLSHFALIPTFFLLISLTIGMPDNFYGRVAVGSFIVFPIIVLLSSQTYRFIEKPFLRLRMHYLRPYNPGHNG